MRGEKKRYIVRSRRSKSSLGSSATLSRGGPNGRASREKNSIDNKALRSGIGVNNTVRIAALMASSSGAGTRSTRPPTEYSRGTVVEYEHTDGARSSHASKGRRRQTKDVYSMMHVPEVPAVQTSGRSLKKVRCSEPSNAAQLPPEGANGEYAHTGPLDSVSRPLAHQQPRTVGWGKAYDPRIDPQSQATHGVSGHSISKQSPCSSHMVESSPTLTTRSSKVRLDGTALREIVDSTRFLQGRLLFSNGFYRRIC